MSGPAGRPMSQWIIEAHGLTKVYPMGRTEVKALRGVSLKVAAGGFLALMGASGSGKSTLLHILGCLDTPTEGHYCLEGQEVGQLSPAQRSRVRNTCIGFVFQSFNLLPRLNALENVALPLLYRGRVDRPLAQAAAALDRVGLADRGAHRPAELSGGECQRVAIARALVANPGVILADEPTGNLDSVTGAGLMELLIELNRAGSTILMVTHDPQVAAYAEAVVYLRDGRILSAVGTAGPPIPSGYSSSGAP
jgi:putative ABC transport system ATP-binding protein